MTGLHQRCERHARALAHPASPAISKTVLNELKRAPKTAIVVVGGGRRAHAPEYGMSTLHPGNFDRLRYGLWLARETNLPGW